MINVLCKQKIKGVDGTIYPICCSISSFKDYCVFTMHLFVPGAILGIAIE